MKTMILSMFTLVLISEGAVGADFNFSESFDTYLPGKKAGEQQNKSSAVLWDNEANTEIVDWEAFKSKINSNPPPAPPQGSGGKMLQFTYLKGFDSWSEQRFILDQKQIARGVTNPIDGKKGLGDIWMQYDVYIPEKYSMIDRYPASSNTFGGGHKVAVFYADGYSFPNTTMIYGEVFARKDLTGKTVPMDENAAYYIDSTFSYYPNPTDANERAYHYAGSGEIRRDSDTWVRVGERNRWQRRTFHFKFPSDRNKNDGLMEVWIQRFSSNGGSIVDKAMSSTGSFFGKQNYFNAGYINGYNNDGFVTDVNMLIDNFRLVEGKGCVTTTDLCVPDGIDRGALNMGVASGSAGGVEIKDTKITVQ